MPLALALLLDSGGELQGGAGSVEETELFVLEEGDRKVFCFQRLAQLGLSTQFCPVRLVDCPPPRLSAHSPEVPEMCVIGGGGFDSCLAPSWVWKALGHCSPLCLRFGEFAVLGKKPYHFPKAT